MSKLQISAEIEAPPEQVYEYFLDMENWALPFGRDVHAKKNYVGNPRIGDTFDVSGKLSGRGWKARLRFTELVPNSKIVCEQVSGEMRSSGDTLVFEKTEGGTLVTETWEYKVPYSFLGQMLDSLKIKKELQNYLGKRHSTVKETLERSRAVA